MKVFSIWQCLFLAIIAGFIMQSCASCGVDKSRVSPHSLNSQAEYAKGFFIKNESGYSLLSVRNPWEGAKGVEFNYILAKNKSLIPDSLRTFQFVKVPVKNMVCLSTTQLAMVESLGELDAISGISELKYVCSRSMINRIDAGLVKEVGYEQSINYEQLLQLKPDIVLAYGVGTEVTGTILKLKDLGIPVIFDAEYLEELPLGKTEWIRVLGALFAKEAMADSLFSEVKSNYLKLTTLVKGSGLCPVIMTGLPWKDNWNVPPGNSTTAHLIEDAGGEYLWKDKKGAANFILSLEEVIHDANRADIWINPGTAVSMADITNLDVRLSSIRPYGLKRIYNNNRRMGIRGGNDYWESGVMHPDLILADLIRILHPGLIDSSNWNYYVKLQ